MINQKRTAAVLLGLTMGLSGSVFAAPAADGADQDLAARIAAIEAQQQKLNQQLDALKKENAQLKRTKKVAESNKNAIKGLKEAQNRVQLHGFGRVTWDNDNIKGYIDRNDNRRFYLDLKGQFKVNDKWNFNFESETNPRYANYVMADGTLKSHWGRDDEDGVIQRIWADGKIGVFDFDIGRRWRGLGFQNVLLGNETDGVVVSTPINKKGLKASAFYLTPTDKGYDFSVAGVGIQGQVAPKLQINCAFAKLNVGKGDSLGQNVYDKTTTYKIEGSDVTIKDISGKLKAGGEFKWYGSASGDTSYGEFNSGEGLSLYYTDGIKGKVDATGNVTLTETVSELRNTAGSHGFVLSAMWNPMKNIFLIGDYARTNARSYNIGEWGAGGYTETKYNKKDCMAFRLNYRWSNVDNPGSFQLYARWYDYAKNANNLVGIMGDKEWGLLQPGSHGWVVGFKYVPAKNIEWETMYSMATAQNTLYGHKNESYHRNFIRTQIDYHF
ncbi:coiled-coil domain-containing protein [Selenomonas ruminantium]|uniref:Porin n=1 Tax=Selenomonas ruminantium TaxID=971 RepID=A0A1H0QS84_SELRU|nr:S-layer homology domain-containing protein [Selenomonas ruminantium]SDP20221.1 hypothetical protein SAMN05216366_10940 [Selenomonas ruminantium]